MTFKGIIFVTLLFSTVAQARETVSTLRQIEVQLDGEAVNILSNAAGFSLYTFDPDLNGESTCYEGCARTWPPVIVTPEEAQALAPGLTTVERKDQSLQLRYEGRPLYKFIRDQLPGETKGEGLGGVWHLIRTQNLP